MNRMKDIENLGIDLLELDNLISKTEKKKSIEELIAPYLAHWRWIVLSVVLALILGLIYLRYAEKIYMVNSSIILKHQRDARLRGGNAVFSSMDLMGTVSNVDNEIEVIRSKSLIRGAVNMLDLHTSYIVKGRIKSNDLYKGSSVQVTMEQEDLDKLKSPLTLTVVPNKDQSVSITHSINNQEKTTKINHLPALFSTSAGVLTVSFRSETKPSYGVPIEVIIRNPNSVVPRYRSNLSVTPTSKTTSVLNLRLNTGEPAKGIDFINTLVNVYNQDAIADKNREALNTKDFIDERIAIIDRELGDAERKVEYYKRSQGLTDLQSDVQLSLQRGSQYEQKLVDVSTQINLVEYLDNYVREAGNKNKLVPSNVGINDPTLTATINEYNKQILERERLLRTNTETNPVIQKYDVQIEALREAIGTSIASVKQGLLIAKRDAQNQVNYYKGQTGMAPTQERQFTEIAREQQIKSSLFLMLLQKREENALALSASANSAKVLDEASVTGPIKPKRIQVLMAALILGLLVPILVVFLKDLLHFKISSRHDVEKLTKLPILGEIPQSETGAIAVHENENKESDEAFRMLRTNLLFALGKDKSVVIVTSTEPKEGKTFVSLNTALSLAMLKKKVLLIGLDLRLPKLHEYLDIDDSRGMSQFLSGYESDILEIIQPSKIMSNLHVIPSGKVPPNPSELIAREVFDEGIEVLRKNYDYIVIDSAPVSLVTDTVVASRVADATVYVCRANVSHKNNLRFANELSEKKMLPNMTLAINDVVNYSLGYGYGYGRNAKYGYGYKKARKKKNKIDIASLINEKMENMKKGKK
ncbi:MAG: polysaccharide biosynthesis tyrosine autokinase [Porphyromonadaceae bacterium]|nr:polysaccharide biosynthesis tyrosine autokinase [Porphyromonadaceae bacterium]